MKKNKDVPDLLKCPKCSLEFTGNGWNRHNINRHLNKYIIKVLTGNKQLTDMIKKMPRFVKFVFMK